MQPVWLCSGRASRRSVPRITGVRVTRSIRWRVAAAVGALDQFGVERQNAAVLRPGFFFGRERAVLDFVQFKDRGGLKNLLDARGIVDARQLDQNLALGVLTAARLNSGLSQPQAVDSRLDRADGALHGVPA